MTFITVVGAYTILLESFAVSRRAEPIRAEAKPAREVVGRPLATRDESR